MLGPVTQIPASLHRKHILMCLGEDPAEFEAALQAAGAPHVCTHAYRGFRCYVDDERLVVLGGIGVGSQEPLLWELLRQPVDRIILTGTSGALGGFTGAAKPHFLPTAHAAYSAMHAHPKRGFHANLASRLPTTMAVSTDAFYGFGPAILNGEYPSEPALEASYGMYKDADALVDMETAYFYWAAPRFSTNPDLEYGAIRAAANAVTNFDEMATQSETALASAVAASWAALQA
ncbi:MAG: hypothetical protein ACPHK8_01875 [Thermoplasmatota archaeon]